MNQSFSVWYASEKRVNSPTKLVVFDSKGALTINDKNDIDYVGSKNVALHLNKSDIVSVSLARQKLNWVIYIIIVPILLIFATLYLYTTSNNFILSVGLSLILVMSATAFGAFIGLKTKWVMVEHKTPDQKTEKAYFASSSGFGWGGIAGGTQLLFNILNSQSNKENPAPAK